MAHSAPIEIVPYDPTWLHRFKAERGILLEVFGSVPVQVEHVGSTAVPGLGAKPIIDIMLGVERLADIEARISDLVTQGYEYIPRWESEFPERRLFAKPQQQLRHFHLHAVERSTAFWHDHLLFRDFLRHHGDVASEYYALKKRLAAEFGDDREGYTNAKTAFIGAALECARRERPSP